MREKRPSVNPSLIGAESHVTLPFSRSDRGSPLFNSLLRFAPSTGRFRGEGRVGQMANPLLNNFYFQRETPPKTTLFLLLLPNFFYFSNKNSIRASLLIVPPFFFFFFSMKNQWKIFGQHLVVSVCNDLDFCNHAKIHGAE